MTNELRAWISQEVDRRGWSYRELARRSGVSHTLVSRMLSGDMPPSADFCIKVAQALEEPPEKLLRLAGILPPSLASEDDPTIAEIQDILKNLPPAQHKEVLRFLRFLYQASKDE
jgi:transcriptional regulator with XRE-family HTH domain